MKIAGFKFSVDISAVKCERQMLDRHQSVDGYIELISIWFKDKFEEFLLNHDVLTRNDFSTVMKINQKCHRQKCCVKDFDSSFD